MASHLINSQLFDSFVQKRSEEYTKITPRPSVQEFAKMHVFEPFDQVRFTFVLRINYFELKFF
jgi:hypothetical protein